MLVTRRALVVGLAGFIAACAGPGPQTPTPNPAPAGSPSPAAANTPSPAPRAAASPLPSPSPLAAASPSPTSLPAQVEVAVHLWNGDAAVQLDGRTIQPGTLTVDRGVHHAAALVDGNVVATADTPADGGSVDLVVPPPLASLAVMIENQADARPQTGLTHADVVYECLAEGGITRFVALYLTGDASVVGPVRSLRHYFAFLAEDYGADVIHIGASPEGYAWRDAMHMGHLDETYGDPGIWRVTSRPPPHNAYTDTAADRVFLQQRGWQQNHSWGPLLFSDQAERGILQARDISLSFRPWAYRVEWIWDDASSRYMRWMEGEPHRDAATGDQIVASTVVCQFAEINPIPNDEKLRLDINLVNGGGQLVVLSNGTRRDGAWIKPAATTTSVWLDVGGQPFVLPPGPVWVEVMPNESPLNVS